MTDILEKIKDYKLEEIKQAKSKLPIKDLEDMAKEADQVRFFGDTLKSYGLISEIKTLVAKQGAYSAGFRPSYSCRGIPVRRHYLYLGSYRHSLF